jgi:segregation and condensation protein B
LRALLSEEISAWGEDTWNAALEHLRQRYASDQHGIELVEMGGGFQFRTKSEHAHRIKRLAKVQTQKLSSGAMETLAIVAYKQPVMKEDIDQVRGVDSSHFVRTLLDRKLIEITGRSELPGRPMLYSTTPEFLQLFGLGSLSALPSLRELEQMVPASVGRDAGEDADPRVREMRKLVNQMTTDVSVTLSYDPREDERFLQEIREKVQAIPTTTAFIEEQKAEDQRTALAAHLQATVVLESPSETISTQPSIG